MFIKVFEVYNIDPNRGVVEVELENGEIVSYPYHLIGVKNMKLKPTELMAMVVGEDRTNAVAILFPKHELIKNQIMRG